MRCVARESTWATEELQSLHDTNIAMADRRPKKTTTMAPKRGTTPTAPTPAVAASSKAKPGGPPSIAGVAANMADYYKASTPQRTKLLDAFMAFLAAVGGLQFLYCVLAGNYVGIHSLLRLCLRAPGTCAD